MCSSEGCGVNSDERALSLEKWAQYWKEATKQVNAIPADAPFPGRGIEDALGAQNVEIQGSSSLRPSGDIGARSHLSLVPKNNKKEEALLPYEETNNNPSLELAALWAKAEAAVVAPALGQPKPDYVPKVPTTFRLDAENLAWLKEKGPGYQTRVNALLSALREADRATQLKPAPLAESLGIDQKNVEWLLAESARGQALVNGVLTALRTASQAVEPSSPAQNDQPNLRASLPSGMEP